MSRAQELARQTAVLAAVGAAPRTTEPEVAARLHTDLAGLLAYQRNAQATAQRVLCAHFPTVQAMVGEDTLRALACWLWQLSPPTSGDLGEWGGELPALLASHPDLQAWPWLADCARLDWARHHSERAADATLDTASLALLGEAEPDQLCLDLHPSVRLVRSDWPVASLWAAHQAPAPAQAEAARHALAHAGPECALVWRQARQPRVAPVSEADGAWLHALLGGDPDGPAPSLSALLDQVAPGFDFSAWLTQAVSQGCLWRVRLRQP